MNIFRNKTLGQLVANFRNEYFSNGINEDELAINPIDQFEYWLQEAVKSKVPEPNAMHLATATHDGKPSGRVILLKGFDHSGFIFFSNYKSRKGHELTDNPHAAMTFLWLELFRQVRIEGIVSKISEAESEAYFQSRPRNSQLGAWASEQSKALRDRQELEDRFRDAEKLFDGKPVLRPPHWGGYCLKPTRIEFWQGRAGRIHDRIEYTLQAEGIWKKQRLFP
jgi:pyridoxamine 5'-phosphate oxidase